MNTLTFMLATVFCFTAINAQLMPILCGSKKQSLIIKKFEIGTCTEFPCAVTRGTNATLKMELVPMQPILGLKLSVYGILGGIEVPFKINSDNHCQTAIEGSSCPLQKSITYEYKNTIQVSSQYPPVSVIIRYQISDLNDKQLLCAQWPSKII